MDAEASTRKARGPKGVVQEHHLIQVPPAPVLDAGLRRYDENKSRPAPQMMNTRIQEIVGAAHGRDRTIR